ncbi:MAG: 16S rRNA processing protein RimM [Bacteroidota bacterium]
MPKAVTYQSIGFTKKTYGVKGALKLKIEDHYLEDFAQAEVVFLALNGRKIPYFVEAINFDTPFTLQLEDIDTKEKAIELTSKEIFLRQSDLIPLEEKVFDVPTTTIYLPYIGYIIHDEKLGELGEIERIESFPQQEMAVLTINEKEVLIPLNEALIVLTDAEKRTMVMDLPEGLLALDKN